MPPAASRLAAFEAFRRISAGEIDLPQALAATRARLADDRDRGLAAEIVTGTQRWRAALDFLIERYAARPLSRLDAEVVDILRLGAYQLLHLDRVPAAAVVNDAVELTRTPRKPAPRASSTPSSGLRRDREHPPLPLRPPADTPPGQPGTAGRSSTSSR